VAHRRVTAIPHLQLTTAYPPELLFSAMTCPPRLMVQVIVPPSCSERSC